MELAVYNIEGSETGKTVNLPDEVFGIEPNDHTIYLDVKQHLANKRQGTHKSKERAEIKGSTKKLKKQKGTGTARAGSIKSPLFRGGGRVFGPKPRDYGFKLNKKVKRLARKSALSYKASESNVTILETIAFEAPKTKEMIKVLGNLSLGQVKTLIVSGEDNKNLYLSARNLPKSKVVPVTSLNTYDILHADRLVILEDAVDKFANL